MGNVQSKFMAPKEQAAITPLSFASPQELASQLAVAERGLRDDEDWEKRTAALVLLHRLAVGASGDATASAALVAGLGPLRELLTAQVPWPIHR